MTLDALPLWRNVEAVITSGRYGYGDLIPYNDLHDLLRLPKPPADARSDLMDSWRMSVLQELTALRQTMLVEHRMMLDTEAGVGVRILLPSEQTLVSEAALRKELARTLRTHRDRITHVNSEHLTADQRRENADAQVRLAKRVCALREVDRSRLLTSART